MAEFTHFNRKGDAHMVDVGNKDVTHRLAVAEGRITLKSQTLEMIRVGGHKKGDVLGIARVAGIMASKKTSELIPLCHPLSLTAVDIDFILDRDTSEIKCRARVEYVGKTGVEMEALTAVQIALLTIYDMCKAVDRGMSMHGIHLLRKSGGQSGDWIR